MAAIQNKPFIDIVYLTKSSTGNLTQSSLSSSVSLLKKSNYKPKLI